MESSNSPLALLDSTSHIPIAELSPSIPEASTKAIKAIVTLTWPYSSATGSVAFLLSEPDFRLRRSRGQVRVQFAGSSAKRVAKSSIASGDEVVLCLAGVEWIQDDGKISTPGRGIEFELRFTERVLLKFRQEDAQDSEIIDIDHPPPESELPIASILPEAVSDFIPLSTPATNGTSTRIELQNEDGVYSSPAFVKRARTSYGSLFELDPFADEDGTVKGKGRKRTRLSSTWTYTSRSPTPEADVSMEEEAEEPPVETSKPVMMDEGSQTIGLKIGDAAESLAKFSRQAINSGGISYSGLQSQLGNSPNLLSPNGNHIQTPSIQTNLVEQTRDFNGDTPPIPQSPKLQPLSSDSLPLVSPLISRGFAIPGYQPTPDISELGQTPKSRPSIPADFLGENGDEDLYNASPVALNRGQSAGLAEVDTNVADVNRAEPLQAEPSHAEPELNLSSQPTTVLSHHSQSPFDIPGNSTEIPDDDAFGIGEHQNNQYDLTSLQHGQTPVQNLHEYPDLDSLSAPIWTPVPMAVGYPDLSEPLEASPSVHSQQRHKSTAMSHSQSARSQQSQVVGLVESDDDEDAHGELDADDRSVDLDENSRNQQNPGSHYIEQDPNNFYEGSQDDEEMTENEYTEDEDGQFVRKYPDQGDEEFEGEEEMEEFEDDDGYAEDNEQYDRGLYPQEFENEDEDEDEEGSYDEDESMGDEEPRKSASQGPPVVIDLLSSDDEDDSAPPPKSRTAPHQAEPSTSEEEEDEESGLDAGIPDIRSKSNSESEPESSDQDVGEDIQQGYASESAVEDVESEPEEMDLVPTTALPDDPYAINSSYGAMPHDAEDVEEEVIEEEIEEVESEELVEGEIEERHSEEAIVEEETSPGSFDKDHSEEVIVEDEAAPGPIEQIPHDESLVDEEGVEDKDESDPENQSDNAITVEVQDQDKLAGPEDEVAEAEVQDAGSPIKDSRDFEAIETVEVAGSKTADGEESDQREDNQSSESAVGEVAEANAMEDDDIGLHESSREVSEEIEENPRSGPASPVSEDAMEVQEEAQEVVEELVENVESEPHTITKDADDDLDEMDLVPAKLEKEEESVEKDTADEKNDQDTMWPRTRSQKDQFKNAKAFGLDGAHDISPKRARRGTKTAQLPTPDDTQVSQNPVSTDSLFTNISQSQEAGEEPKAGPEFTASKDIEINEFELPLDTDEALLDESTVIEKIVHEAEAAAMDELAPPDESTVIERIVEEAKVTALESVSPPNISRDEAADEEEPIKTAPKKPTGKKRAKPLFEPTSVETTTVAPRRSHRRDASQNIPKTPTKHNDKNRASSSMEDSVAMVVVEQQFSPRKGHDASVELALSSLESPSKQRNETPQSAAETKFRLARALRTELEEFTSLKVIRYHLNAKLDFLAIVTTAPPEPTRNKMRQYQMSFNVTDPNIAPNAVIEVQISRPHIHALPNVKSGDGILLREFKVIAAKNRGFALSADHNNETASWAVFKGDVDEEPEMRGRPVELGDIEKRHVASLKAWFHTLDEDNTAKAKLERANAALADSSPAKKGAGSR